MSSRISFNIALICLLLGLGIHINLFQSSITTFSGPTFDIAQEDTLRPEIYAWGFDSTPVPETPFTVWANASDTQSEIKNVTVIIEQGNFEYFREALVFNGTHYAYQVLGLPNNYTYSVLLNAFDTYDNVAQTSVRTLDFVTYLNTPVDPTVTMPLVVVTSLGILAGVIFVAYIYDKRMERYSVPTHVPSNYEEPPIDEE